VANGIFVTGVVSSTGNAFMTPKAAEMTATATGLSNVIVRLQLNYRVLGACNFQNSAGVLLQL